MNQQIQLNIIPFTPVVDSLSFAFYADKQKGLAPIYWNKIVDTFPEGREPKFKNYYTDFLPAKEGGIVKEIKLVHAINFSLHYFRHIIFNYFKAIEGAIVFPNFTDDVEVWFHDTTLSNPVYKRYNSFTVKVQYNQVTTGYEMVLAYNGASKILNKSIADIDDFDTKNYNLINCNGTIYKYQYMPEDLRQNQETLFPVLSNHLIKFFLKGKQKLVKENRFPIYLNLITNFYNAYLNIPVFKSIINISTNGFYNVPSEGVYQTHSNSNLLQFKNGTNVNPGYGLTKHKPLLAYTENHVKLFFIYHRNDGPYIKTNLYDIFINGWCRKVKGNERYAAKLSNYINQPFSIDPEKRVVFENTDTIFEEVAETLKNFVWEPNTKYVAIYVSPISKTDTEHPQHNAYYKIKELLLHKEITSQVLFRDYLELQICCVFIK